MKMKSNMYLVIYFRSDYLASYLRMWKFKPSKYKNAAAKIPKKEVHYSTFAIILIYLCIVHLMFSGVSTELVWVCTSPNKWLYSWIPK